MERSGNTLQTTMKTYRTMRLAVLVCQLCLILRTEAQLATCIGQSTYRPPENNDITVNCGTEFMEMSIYICPVYQALYNESLMALNGQFSKNGCNGIPDWTVIPPVLRFKFAINEVALANCNNNIKISSEVGTGIFADFSNVQFVNISGVINSKDPTEGTITYRQQILYKFSCYYPLQYLVNNTQLGVSGVSLAVRDNNGSFISTLSMQLYSDVAYTLPLNMPASGLNLKTRIFVGVKATNLTNRFNVLLDRCYATTKPIPSQNNTSYDLFVGCTRDGQTKVEDNGISQQARFSFEAFRFVEHRNLSTSTFYLHCITRLCEVAKCASIMPNCSGLSRRRRAAPDESSDVATVSSPPILVTVLTPDSADMAAHAASVMSAEASSPLVYIIATVAVLAILFVSMTVFLGLYFRKRKADN